MASAQRQYCSSTATCRCSQHPRRLGKEVVDRVLFAEALPDCLQPLLKSVLLSLLGDLEAVWADRNLRDLMLDLPLHAMKLLMSCSELKVR